MASAAAGGLAGGAGTASVYWLGADKNYYAKSATGTQKIAPGSVEAQRLLLSGAKAIADPNPPRPGSAPAPSNPTGRSAAASSGSGGGGGGAAPAKVDKSNDIALQRAGLAAVDQQTGAGLSAIDAALARLTGQYDTERNTNEATYKTSSDTNVGNLQKGKQTAYVNASQGRQAVFSQLAGVGALSGDGITLANNAVKKGANDDLSGVADNYAGNQSSLDTSIGTFRQQDKQRRDDAVFNADNARTNVRADAAKSKMSFLGNISNNYAAMGDAGNAKAYSDQAAALYPEVARNNVPNANISYSGAAFTAPSLANYIAGADSTEVAATPATPGESAFSLPSLFVTNKKKQLAEAV